MAATSVVLLNGPQGSYTLGRNGSTPQQCNEFKAQRILALIDQESRFSELSDPQRHWFSGHLPYCEPCRKELAKKLNSPKPVAQT